MERNQVPAERKWRTEDIFENQQEFEKLYRSVNERINFTAYQGKLSDPGLLFACLESVNAVVKDLSILSVYAYMRHDEDTRSSEFSALLSRTSDLEMKLASQTAFITPELTALPDKTLRELAANPKFRDYDYTIRNIIRQKPHILSAEMENLLSQESKVFDTPRQVFTMLNNADFAAPTIRAGGKCVTLTHGMYGMMLRSPDRHVRKSAFQAYYKFYIQHAHTLAQNYIGNIEKNIFLARARHYGSSVECAMDAEDVSVRVYNNLMDSVNEALPMLHRYFADRKRILGCKKLHMYDIYTSLVEDAELSVDYEEAFRIVKEGLLPLGERYQQLLDEAHDNGWIDVEETDGKRSGAYSICVYGLKHPYVLLNYQKCTNDIFTIAHELGHAMHSYHSCLHQPQEKADYKIFVAEVASTVNEVLLIKHLLKKATDVRLKKYLLSYYLDMLKSTLFRQTQFAEFEYQAHAMAERGEPLTVETLCDMYYKLNHKYYGPAVVSDDEIAYEWSRIPHFYRSFYVYKYATGIISAVSIADRIENGGQAAVDDYFRFLSSGGSDSPVELLKLAGVDLMKKDAFRTAMASFEHALREFESL